MQYLRKCPDYLINEFLLTQVVAKIQQLAKFDCFDTKPNTTPELP